MGGGLGDWPPKEDHVSTEPHSVTSTKELTEEESEPRHTTLLTPTPRPRLPAHKLPARGRAPDSDAAPKLVVEHVGTRLRCAVCVCCHWAAWPWLRAHLSLHVCTAMQTLLESHTGHFL